MSGPLGRSVADEEDEIGQRSDSGYRRHERLERRRIRHRAEARKRARLMMLVRWGMGLFLLLIIIFLIAVFAAGAKKAPNES